MASSNPSKEALALLDNISNLSNGLKNGQQGAREGLLNACSRLISELSNPSEQMLMLVWAQPTHLTVVRLAVEIKLLHALVDVDEAGKSTAEIASKCEPQADPVLVGTTAMNLSARVVTKWRTGRMLRHLAAMGTIRETGPDTFAPTPTSRAFTEGAFEDSIVFIADGITPVHHAAPSYFRQNGFKLAESSIDAPFQHVYNCKGTTLFEYFQKHDFEMGRRFASMMDVWPRGRPRWFFKDYYPVKERLIDGAGPNAGTFLVDVGGGTGHDIEGFREAFGKEIPGKLVLQDRPEIVNIAQVDSSVEKMGHDFMNEQPLKGERDLLFEIYELTQSFRKALELTTSIILSKIGTTKYARRS